MFLRAFICGHFLLCSAGELGVVAAKVGQSVTLNGSTTSELVDWWYQRSVNSPVQQICSAGVMVNGFEADGRYSLTNGSLVIDNVTVRDNGLYSVAGQGNLRIVYLNVSGNYNDRYYLCHYNKLLRATAYAIARICYRPSVRLSVRHTGGSVKNA